MPRSNVRRARVRSCAVLLVAALLMTAAGCGVGLPLADPDPESTTSTAEAGGSAGNDPAESALDFVPLGVEPMPCGEDAFAEGGICLVPAGEVLGDDIVESAEISLLEPSGWAVALIMTANGITRFNETAASCFEMDETCPSGQLGIISGGELVSAPMIQAASFERDQILISGNFTHEEALALVDALNS